MLLFYFKPQNQCSAQKRCKCTYNVFALNVEVMQIHIFTKYWKNSRFNQNLAVILTEAMYLDRRHPFMQKSYFGQNVTYTVFALRGRYSENLKKSSSLEPNGQWPWKLVCSIGYLSTPKFIQMMTLSWLWPILRQGQIWSLMLLYGKKIK